MYSNGGDFIENAATLVCNKRFRKIRLNYYISKQTDYIEV